MNESDATDGQGIDELGASEPLPYEYRAVVPITGWESLIREKLHPPISFGCKTFDSLLGGGVKRCVITEIAGEAGTGKTQLCLQLLLSAVCSVQNSEHGRAIFLSCGEGSFPAERLEEMAKNRNILMSLFDHIQILKINNVEEQFSFITEKLSEIVELFGADLVVIDSISALFRSEICSIFEHYSERSEAIFLMAQALKKMSDAHRMAIVVVNQVSTKFDRGDEVETVPSLGFAWANCVNTRLFLKRKRSDNPTLSARELSVEFSPYWPPLQIPFAITAVGVTGSV